MRLGREVARGTLAAGRFWVGVVMLATLFAMLPATPAAAAAAGLQYGTFEYGPAFEYSGMGPYSTSCTADTARSVVASPGSPHGSAPAEGAWTMHTVANLPGTVQADAGPIWLGLDSFILDLCGWYEPSGYPLWAATTGCPSGRAGDYTAPRGFGGQGWLRGRALEVREPFDPWRATAVLALRFFDVGWEITDSVTVMTGYYQVHVDGVAQDHWGQITMTVPWPSFNRCDGGGTDFHPIHLVDLPEKP